MSKFKNILEKVSSNSDMNSDNWSNINPEYVARMQLQNQFKTGIDIDRKSTRLNSSHQ